MMTRKELDARDRRWIIAILSGTVIVLGLVTYALGYVVWVMVR